MTLTPAIFTRARELAATQCHLAKHVTMETGDGFLVVSKSRVPSSVIPPYAYDYHYDHFIREADATEFYGEIERGIYSDTRVAVTILASRRGVPLGAKRITP